MRKVYQKLSHLWLLLIALLTVPVVATAQDLSSGGDGGSTTIKYQEDFDYDEGDRINGDIVISLDTVATNAEQYGKTYEDELHRVIIHGILHLCGINDKGPGEREIMEAAENEALAML